MKKIIIDTDLGSDCDDASAIALINKFYNEKIIDVGCMLYSNGFYQGAKLTEVINAYYGNSFNIGILKKEVIIPNIVNNFAEKILNELNVNTTTEFYDANELLYENLINSENKSVTVICIGQLRNIANFLNSKFGDIQGETVFNEKVEKIVIMGGNFSQTSDTFTFYGEEYKGEYNIVSDLKSAFTVLKKVTTKTYFCDFNMGCDVFTFGGLVTNCDETNPVSLSYKYFCKGSRCSWDPLTVLYGVFGDNEYFSSVSGNISLNESGRTFFTKNAESNKYIVKLNKSSNETAKYLESFFEKELNN